MHLKTRLSHRLEGWQTQRRVQSLARQVAQHAKYDQGQAPVVFFNASARLSGISQNAAFALLASWALRLAGTPVVHFVCQAGLKPCVLGINRQDFTASPPCEKCIAQSRRLYTGAPGRWFHFWNEPMLERALHGLDVEQLSCFEYRGIPLGALVLPSVRWALRRFHLPDDGEENGPQSSRYLLRQYILSAYSVAHQFASLLDETKADTVVIFNGIMYPEATACWVARQRNVRVITHEVGFQRFSTFFSAGDATAYPIHIPADFQLNAEQNARLDEYLERRFQGKFTMAGIRFWPEMRGLDQAFLERAARFHQVVPIFTNVVYDTSQLHANQVFPHMFAWLDLMLEVIRQHPETLFVIRAHPDEMRPGTAKISNESVADWVKRNGVDQLPNVVFIDSQEYLSSYELIERAKFVIVYNSSIGLEAALLGKVVLCGGKARYTQYPIVYFPNTPEAYRQQAEAFLAAGLLAIPPEYQENARRFLYYQLFRASLSLEAFLDNSLRQGFVKFKAFPWQALRSENSPQLGVIVEGILHGTPFLLNEN